MEVIYKPRGRALEYSPWALNLGKGCSHRCAYCYAPACLKAERSTWGQFETKTGLLRRLEKDLVKFRPGPGERVLLCFTTDPYQSEPVAKLTGLILRQLKAAGIPFQVLTKGGMKAVRHFDLYGIGDAFATTLTFASDDESLRIEPGAALPGDRVEAIRMAKAKGIETWVSFEPALDERAIIELYEKTKDFVDLYKVGKVSRFWSNIKDWKSFGNAMIDRFERDGKKYYIKDDLKSLL